MESESIINLLIGVSGFTIGLVYYLNTSTKKSLDSLGDKLDSLNEAIHSLRETFAARTVEIDFLKEEYKSLKKRCREC